MKRYMAVFLALLLISAAALPMFSTKTVLAAATVNWKTPIDGMGTVVSVSRHYNRLIVMARLII